MFPLWVWIFGGSIIGKTRIVYLGGCLGEPLGCHLDAIWAWDFTFRYVLKACVIYDMGEEVDNGEVGDCTFFLLSYHWFAKGIGRSHTYVLGGEGGP